MFITSQEQLDILTKALDDPWAASEELDEIGFAKWRDRDRANQLRASIFSFTKEEFLEWLAPKDLSKVASSAESNFDGFYAVSEGEDWNVYRQERGQKYPIVSKVTYQEAKLAAFIDHFDGTTGGYLSKLFKEQTV